MLDRAKNLMYPQHMMNSSKSVHRAGWKGCFCCDRRPKNSTTRARETRLWKKDA